MADGNDEIILDAVEFIELDGVRAIAFSKSAVAALASALGYSPEDYDVRFTLVPVGSDGSFDYAITFAKEGDHTAELDTPVTNDDTRLVFVGAGETLMFTITPEVNSAWYFTSYSEGDSYATLYDENNNAIASNDDGAGSLQFLITGTLEAGKTYYLGVRWLGTSASGYMTVAFSCSPVTE